MQNQKNYDPINPIFSKYIYDLEKIDSSTISLEEGIEMLNLKKEVGRFFVYRLDDLVILCRQLKIIELNTIESMVNVVPEYIILDWICRQTVVWVNKGKDYLFTKAKAGFINCIGDSILVKSNVGEEYIELARQENNANIENYNNIVGRVLAKVPGFPVTDYKEHTVTSLIDYAIYGERLIGESILPSGKDKKRMRKGNKVPVKEGYKSIGSEQAKPAITRPEYADIVDPDEELKRYHNL